MDSKIRTLHSLTQALHPGSTFWRSSGSSTEKFPSFCPEGTAGNKYESLRLGHAQSHWRVTRSSHSLRPLETLRSPSDHKPRYS
jgi:hypothetical protein